MIAARTTRRTRATAAERMRAHRAAMAVALELGITPKEAEAVIASRIARARWRQAADRLAAVRSGRRRGNLPETPAPTEPEPRDPPWWNRD